MSIAKASALAGFVIMALGVAAVRSMYGLYRVLDTGLAYDIPGDEWED